MTNMNVHELGAILNAMYHEAPKGETVAMIHLFGVKYADGIEAADGSCKDIAIAAKISESYGTEIAKGVRLAKYVIPK